MVDKFEVLRYPGTKGSIVVHLDWSQMPTMPTVRGGVRQPKHYPLVIAYVDELFADIFRAPSWNPVRFMGQNNVALGAVRLLNSQSVYLTGQSATSP